MHQASLKKPRSPEDEAVLEQIMGVEAPNQERLGFLG